jgi:uncharacterized protein (TIGR00290 family)
MTRARILLSWSSGKDSAFALHVLRQDPAPLVSGLLTTMDRAHGRVAVHAVRQELVVAQAAAAGLPLHRVPLPEKCSNAEYEARVGARLRAAARRGITGIAFGDLFLADVRAYRERLVAAAGLRAHFPLWGRDTRELARAMVDAGLRARITCVDPGRCPAELAGGEFADVLAALPAGVDPCGENGEFHTFAWAGPMFARPIAVRTGRIVARDGFVFADLLPADAAEPQA